METRYQSFKEFYPFYLKEHSKNSTRALHFIGITLAFAWLFWSIYGLEQPVWGWASVVIGYGFAWVAHFFVEHNRPATFKYPLYSLLGDFRMFFDILRHGRLGFDQPKT